MELITPRETPLGDSLVVRRTIPTRGHTTIGAWCFLDHYGPTTLAMEVGPHPHTELQTASWLFSGEVEHRDSAGHHAIIRPGELNLMTAGSGISHSEVSLGSSSVLHGVQLWIALPNDSRHVEPSFEHFIPERISEAGFTAAVFLGSLCGETSRTTSYTPLLGAELHLDAGARIRLELNPAFEHGVLVDEGSVSLNDQAVPRNELAYLAPGERSCTITAHTPTRLLLLGGEPFGESLVMWWNFISRSHEEIVEYARSWRDGEFELPIDDPSPVIPAPELPKAHLKPR